jgi:hypothetical protein
MWELKKSHASKVDVDVAKLMLSSVFPVVAHGGVLGSSAFMRSMPMRAEKCEARRRDYNEQPDRANRLVSGTRPALT